MAKLVRQKKPGPLKPTPNPYPSRLQGWRQSLIFPLGILLLFGGGIWLYKPFYATLQQTLFEGSVWVHSVFIQPFQTGQTLVKETLTYVQLQEELGRLRTENESLKWELQGLRPLTHENEILRGKLQAPLLQTYTHHTARVLSTPYDGLHHFLMIGAGSEEGLEKDQAVVTPEGVVGRIEKVGGRISRVLLLNDAISRIPAMTSISNQKAILAGDGTFFPTLVYLEDIRKVQKGELVVTSGLGGIFPAGLPLGIVEDTAGGKARVRPFVPFRNLEWVHVLNTPASPLSSVLETGLEEE